MNLEWAREPGFLTGTSIGVVSLLIALYQILTAHQRKEPCWAIDTTYLIRGFQSQISGLKVLFADDPVEHLSVSRIAFWNNGSLPIRADDITESSPLRITEGKGVDILDVTLLATNRASNEISVFSVDPELDYVPITFVHLDKGNGAVIQVIHTGKSSDDIQLEGDIIGVDHLTKREIRTYSARRRKRDIFASIVLILGLISMVVLVVNPDIGPFKTPPPDYKAPVWVVVLPFSLYLYMLISTVWPMLRSRLPRGLEAFHDDPFTAKRSQSPNSRFAFWRFPARRDPSMTAEN